jgi:hypothetical protein
MNLIPSSYPVTSNIFGGSAEPTEYEKELLIKKQELEQQIEEISEETNVISKIVVSFTALMDAKNYALLEEIRALEDEVDEAIQGNDEEYHDEFLSDEQFDVLEAMKEENQKRNEQMSEDLIAQKKKKVVSKGSMRLFRLIARICHPDKCLPDDPQLDLKVSFFQQAKAAKAADDYATLQEILECLAIGVTWKSLNLQKAIGDLVNTLNILTITYTNLVERQITKLALAHRHGTIPTAILDSIYRKELQRRKSEALSALMKVRHVRGEPCL